MKAKLAEGPMTRRAGIATLLHDSLSGEHGEESGRKKAFSVIGDVRWSGIGEDLR